MTNYKSLISSAMISDALEEMGYSHQLLPMEIKPNFLEAKIFGRARTIRLKPIGNGDDPAEIHNALYFIERLKKGEVLVVGDAFKSFAFFGELMSLLAKRKGVEGAIIDGCTRDYLETVKMKYPVFSRNSFARDIKKNGMVDKTDGPVKIGEARINPGDLIFGDYDGIAVIPKEIEEKVLAKCLKISDLEAKIKEDLRKGLPADQILKTRGEF